jgi:hypothetical protein
MDRTIRSGCAARSVIAVSMLRGPPLITGVCRPRDGTTRHVRLSRLLLILAALVGVLALAACGDEARDAVDRARSEAKSTLDESGLSDELDRTYTRVDELLDDLEDASADEVSSARRRTARALAWARAQVQREIREARREGATQEELRQLRREAQERVDRLRERIDEAFGP